MILRLQNNLLAGRLPFIPEVNTLPINSLLILVTIWTGYLTAKDRRLSVSSRWSASDFHFKSVSAFKNKRRKMASAYLK